MEVNLQSFCAALQEASEEKSYSSAEVSAYLMDNLFLPYLEEKDIRVSDLDYGAFSVEELEGLLRYIGEISEACDGTVFLCGSFTRSAPSVRTAQAFC